MIWNDIELLLPLHHALFAPPKANFMAAVFSV